MILTRKMRGLSFQELCLFWIKPQTNVYINWYRYDQVDEMAFVDLDKCFADIWYPGPDDIDIFDSEFS